MAFTLGANTIIKENLLVKETIRLLDKQFVILPWANTEFEDEIKQQGDSVSVQTFPRIQHTDGTKADDVIPESTFAIKKEVLNIDTLKVVNVPVGDLEQIQSNLNLIQKVAEQIRYDMKDKMDKFIADTAIAGAATSNKLNNTAALMDKNTAYALIEEMAVRMDEENVPDGERGLFLRPKMISLLRQHPMWDGFREGNQVRRNGKVGEIAGFEVMKTNNTPDNIMLAMDKDSVNFAAQWVGFDVRKPSNALKSNILSSFAMGAKVFGENSKRIVTSKVKFS
nr:MAG TPA: Major capsid protein [Caudoviricetes sp.]DAY11452.1 MAG TPA: Major capsid protein [Caudoviricetes sp.]